MAFIFDPDEMRSSESLNSGVSPTSIGIILQRGGEELTLVKASDRFTVCFTSEEADLPATIPVLAQNQIPFSSVGDNYLRLVEIVVPAENLDVAMTEARGLAEVAFASHVYHLANSPETVVYLSNQLTIQFTASVTPEIQEVIATQFGLQLLKKIEGIPHTFAYQLTPQSLENPIKMANRLMAEATVLIAEANVILSQESFYHPIDSLYGEQWYLAHQGGKQLAPNSHIEVEKAWDITKGVRSVVVAIADDAIDINHPDFQGQGKIVAPKDFKDQDFLPLPTSTQESHGTACAGIAVAEENGKGIVGVAPGCALMPIRTTGYLDDQSIESLFDWAREKGASVISCSWGAAAVRFPLSLRQSAAINRAATQGRQGKGCVIVLAAGNANRPINGILYERNWNGNLLSGATQWLSGFAAHPDAIAVSASTSLNKKASYSNWGDNVSVCAPSNNAPPGMWFKEAGYIPTAPEVTASLPGRSIFTTDRLGELGYDPGNFTRDFGGTSSATPVVAGVVALVLSVNPQLTAQEVKQILQETADKIVDNSPDPQLGLQMGTYNHNGHSQWFGYGKVNAFKAVQSAQQRLKNPVSSRQIAARNDTNMAILDDDPRGISSPIEITESETIKDIQVSVDVEHEFLGDLEISLRTPSNQVILLQNRTLGTKRQLQVTYNSNNTPLLQQLFNQPTAGIWYLWVVDYAPQDTGKLNGWQLVISV